MKKLITKKYKPLVKRKKQEKVNFPREKAKMMAKDLTKESKGGILIYQLNNW